MKKFALVFAAVFILSSACYSATQESNAPQKFDFGYSFLGAYVKTMTHKDELRSCCDKYKVDFGLAVAVAMYESGGDSDLVSRTGAEGLLQIMPRTRQSLRLKDNIEAGVKYLSVLRKMFPDRVDKVIVAYNGGPKAAKSERLRMESLQYLQGVSLYLRLIEQYKGEIENEAANFKVYVVSENDKSWMDLSSGLCAPILMLRLLNPFLAVRGIKPGSKIAYPFQNIGLGDFQIQKDGNVVTINYKAKRGDIYQYLANVFLANMNDFRDDNGLWHNSQLFVGESVQIVVPFKNPVTAVVSRGDTISSIAEKEKISEWELILVNAIFDQKVAVGQTLLAARLSSQVYEVKKGDSLYSIAKKFNVDIKILAKYNGMERPYILFPGMKIFIPN